MCVCVLQMEAQTSSSDNISQFSVDSITSLESREPVFIAAGDIRYRRSWFCCGDDEALIVFLINLLPRDVAAPCGRSSGLLPVV